MKRVSIRASKSVSQAGFQQTVTVRISNGKRTLTSKATVKTK